MKILGAVLELPAYLPQNWQCCLDGSSKMATRILIFSIAIGAEYLSYVKSIATFALTFFGYIILVLASVYSHCLANLIKMLGNTMPKPYSLQILN